MIHQYVLILLKGENILLSVQEYYANTPFHHRRDTKLMEQIVLEQHTETIKAVEICLSHTVSHFGSVCIMFRKVFHYFMNKCFHF